MLLQIKLDAIKTKAAVAMPDEKYPSIYLIKKFDNKQNQAAIIANLLLFIAIAIVKIKI